MRRAKAAYSEFSVIGFGRFGVKPLLTAFLTEWRAPGGRAGLAGAGAHGCSWLSWRPTWWASPDRRRSLPGAGAVKGLARRASKMLWPSATSDSPGALLLPIEARLKDPGTLD